MDIGRVEVPCVGKKAWDGVTVAIPEPNIGVFEASAPVSPGVG